MIRVLVVDDDPLVRLGLTDLVESADDMRLAGEADDGAAAVVRARDADVVLMDVRMPRVDGISATAQITAVADHPRAIVLTTFDLDRYVYDALAAGADGFLLKDVQPADILDAVRVVHRGDGMLHPRAAAAVIGRYHRSDATASGFARRAVSRLTPRERDVLARVAVGESNRQIARGLSMQEGTVKAHVSRIIAALGVENRVQVALVARDADVGSGG